MTNSTYTLPTATRKHSEDNMPDYMEMDNDDAEAGSILMSLSQQPKQNTKPSPPPSSNSTNTMSIRNLLGDSDEGTKRSVPYQTKPREMATTIATTTPQEAKEIPPTYTERRQFTHGMHAQTTSPTLPAASSRMRSTYSPVKKPTESYNWQQQQHSSPPHTYHPQTMQHQQQQQQHQQQQHQQQKQNQYQQHQHQHHQHQLSIKKSYHRHDYQSSYSQQSYQSMKNNPKVRRNALHAYISYMTYSDLTRMKSGRPHPSHSYNVTPLTGKQQYQHPAPPPTYERPPSAQQQQQQYQQQPPLTAFLKHPHVDPPTAVTTPTTPRPNPSLPSIDNHHNHPIDYTHAHHHHHHHPYHSPPLPQPQYRQAYPVLPYPPKHP
ncbi:unnamed protein product [Absidia cylindrospora]